MAQVIDDRWEIKEKLGEGGQGETFLVRDTREKNGHLYALKRLKNLNRLPRFKQEAEAIQSLNHRHILRLIAANLEDAKPFLVSEYCERKSLEDNKSALLATDRDERMGLFEQVCAGLAAAHAAGIVHRDIKPSNIFLRGDGTVVIGDFGLCFVDADERLTETSEAVGARYYMAPELADGRASQVTPRSDVYSLGKLLYWMLTGVVFDRERHRGSRYHLVQFYELDESIEHVNVLLDHMVTEHPTSRFENASEVLAKIRHIRRMLRDRCPSLTAYPQLCKYCGSGMYQQLRTDPTGLHNLGFNAVSGNQLDIFRCENCGHMLIFKDAAWLETLKNTPTKFEIR